MAGGQRQFSCGLVMEEAAGGRGEDFFSSCQEVMTQLADPKPCALNPTVQIP